MLETVILLLASHAVADFIVHAFRLVPFGKPWTARQVIVYAVLILGTLLVLAGTTQWFVLAIYAIVVASCRLLMQSFTSSKSSTYLFSQSMAIFMSMVFAFALPNIAVVTPLIGSKAWLLTSTCYVLGAFFTVFVGSAVVSLLLEPYVIQIDFDGLENGGLLIGVLERTLIFLFILSGQSEGIGFLLAAKAVMRFQTGTTSKKENEFVFIGTLTSFGWAMAATWGTLLLLETVPPLGIAYNSP